MSELTGAIEQQQSLAGGDQTIELIGTLALGSPLHWHADSTDDQLMVIEAAEFVCWTNTGVHLSKLLQNWDSKEELIVTQP